MLNISKYSMIPILVFFIFITCLYPAIANDSTKDSNQLDNKISRLIDHIKIDKTMLTNQANKKIGKNGIYWTPKEMFYLSMFTLIFGFLVILIIGILVYTKAGNVDTDSLLKIFLTPLIIVSAIYLVVVGYTEKQISPVMGLLGTIAGYLLGQQKK